MVSSFLDTVQQEGELVYWLMKMVFLGLDFADPMLWKETTHDHQDQHQLSNLMSVMSVRLWNCIPLPGLRILYISLRELLEYEKYRLRD